MTRPILNTLSSLGTLSALNALRKFPQQAFKKIKPHQWGKNIIHSLKPDTAAEKVHMLGSLIYVPSAILTPIVTQQQLRQGGIPTRERKMLVSQEWVRQGIGAAVHFISFFAGIAAFGISTVANKGVKTKNIMAEQMTKKINPDTLRKIGGSILFATLGNALIRPTLLNGYIQHWFDQEKQRINQGQRLSQLPEKSTTETLSQTLLNLPVGIVPQVTQVTQASANQNTPSFSKRTAPYPRPFIATLVQPNHFATPYARQQRTPDAFTPWHAPGSNAPKSNPT